MEAVVKRTLLSIEVNQISGHAWRQLGRSTHLRRETTTETGEAV